MATAQKALPAFPFASPIFALLMLTPRSSGGDEGARIYGPHSKVATPNGGLTPRVRQPPEPISRFRWSEGVEVLGTSSLLTCYDLEALRFPLRCPEGGAAEDVLEAEASWWR